MYVLTSPTPPPTLLTFTHTFIPIQMHKCMQAHKYRGLCINVRGEVTLAGACTQKKKKKKKEKLASDVTLLWSVGVVPKPRQTPLDSTLGWSNGRPGLQDLDQGRKHTAWFSHQSLLLLETYSRREAGFSLCPALSHGLGKTG